MLELVLVVEEKIVTEMKEKKGTIIQYGWGRSGKHYVVLLAGYMLE